jgi:hypothetical protein
MERKRGIKFGENLGEVEKSWKKLEKVGRRLKRREKSVH